MKDDLRKSGIEIVGDVPWGTHLCQFYQSKEDLIEILVPYFKQGLENNEFCMWATSEPLRVEEAKKALKEKVKDLDRYIKKGQIEILDYTQWYTKTGKFDADTVLEGCVEKEKQAIEKGFDGLRLTGNIFWLEKKDWENFIDYEALVNSVIRKHRMLAICSYSFDRCQIGEVIDVVNNHQCALIRKEGTWALLGSSEHKKADEAVALLKQRMEFILGATKTGLDIIDSDFNMVYIDPEWQKVYGEYKGKKCYKYFMGSNTVCPNCGIVKALKTKKPVVSEEVLVKEGNRPVQVTTIPFKDEKGKWLVAEVNVDITERKKAEEKIKLFSDAIASAFDCFMLTDLNGNFTYANESALRAFGYTFNEFLKLNIAGLDADPKVAVKIKQETVVKGRWGGEVINIRKNGEIFPSLLSAFIIKDDKGNPKGMMGILRDITERKRAEEALKNAYLELEEEKKLLTNKNIAFQEVIKEIEIEKNELKDEIIVNVNEMILPILKRIRLKEGAPRKYLDLLEKSLETVTSSFGRRLIEKTLKLTPKEIEVCNMVKSGLTTKEISGLLNTSSQTIDKHRKNIRKKLGLSNKSANLTYFLKSL